MTNPTNRSFRRLAVATSIMVYLLIVVGGVVRITGSGLGCPDWPLCYGRLIPPPDTAAIIEFTHRVVAAAGGALLLATLGAAWQRSRRRRDITGPITFSVGLLVLQVPLGALVVATELEPLAVAFHLGMAMLIFAGVLLTTIAAFRPAGEPPVAASRTVKPGAVRLLTAALVATFLLLITGALVVGSDAQLACPDWSLCHDGLLPPANASPLIGIHLLHRYTVAATSVLLAAVVVTFRRRGMPRPLARWAAVLGTLFAVQVVIGGVQVLLQIPMLWRALHLAAAGGVWGVLVVLAGLSAPGQAVPERRPAPAPPESAMPTPAQK